LREKGLIGSETETGVGYGSEHGSIVPRRKWTVPFWQQFFSKRAKTTSRTTSRITSRTTSTQKDITSTGRLVCSCGRSGRPSRTDEISGGEEARPHEFPWIVRLFGGCPKGLCAGSLVSPRVILSAYHCTVPVDSIVKKPCDHSDGKRLAAFGRHEFYHWRSRSYYTIPVIKVLAPPHGHLRGWNYRTHDFALLLLEHPVKYTSKVSPICLPMPNAEFGGRQATAAGWGRTDKPTVNIRQSPTLQKVELTVSPKKYRHTKMFGTILSEKEHEYQDPCSGDSGGPLMYQNKVSARYVLIGTVQGHGYDCRTDQVNLFEGSDNGLWNKVSAHMDWIQDTMQRFGENVCKADRE